MIWKLLWLFLIYSFAGWVLETVLASLKQKKFANRGIINGPFCLIYGFGGFFITAFTRELTGIWLFLGCAIVASLLEWIAGHLIEMWYHERWWDYRKIKWNLDGYVSVPTSCVWGLLGVFVIKIGNGLCMSLYGMLPGLISRIIILVLLGFLAVDAIATLTILFGHSKNPERWIAADRDIDSVTKKLGAKIDDVVNRRITKAYPQKQHTEKEAAHPEIFYAVDRHILLRFSLGGPSFKQFVIVSGSDPLPEREIRQDEKIIVLLPDSIRPETFSYTRPVIFAIRQESGTHRFFARK